MFSKAVVLLSVFSLVVYSVIIPEAALPKANTLKPASCLPGRQCSKPVNGMECHGSYVYQCTTSSLCRSFGYRKSCADCGKLDCESK